jgi:hypothetical protein
MVAQANTRGVGLATMGGAAIPEIGAAPDIQLDPLYDIHFGVNLPAGTHPALYADLGPDDLDQDLEGLGPRTIDIKRRGGRTAEDDWYIAQGEARARPKSNMDDAAYKAFNERRPIKRADFPAAAMLGNAAVGNQAKDYTEHNTNTKYDAGGLEKGTRWSKTALEKALSYGRGNIHFHLDGMGNLAGIFDKTGGYGYNVTSRELRYVKRFWMRFQWKVIFYNGYTGALLPVIVYPPWLAAWEPDAATAACRVCAKNFSKIFPIRWRHHCRLCGRNVCDVCSPHSVRLKFPAQRPGSARETGAVRICSPCYLVFNRGDPSQ